MESLGAVAMLPLFYYRLAEKRKGKYSTFGNVCIGQSRSNRQATERVPVYVVLDTNEGQPFSTELPRESPYLGLV